MRPAAVVRTAAGLVELAGPDTALVSRLWDRPSDARVHKAAQALACRNLVTAAILAMGPRRRIRLALAGIDALHAASMAGLAVRSRRYRRPAMVSAAMAVVLAVATAAE